MPVNDDELNHMLRQALVPVHDQGFTEQVITTIRHDRKRHTYIIWGLIIAGIAPVLLFLPIPEAGAALAHLPAHQALSPAAYGLAVLILLWAWYPRLLRL